MAYLVLAGYEPLTFTNIFPYWEKDSRITSKVGFIFIKYVQCGVSRAVVQFWTCVVSRRQAETKNKVVLVKEALSKLSRQQYSIEELTRKPLPEGVDPLRLEDYLSDQDFRVPDKVHLLLSGRSKPLQLLHRQRSHL